MRPSLMRHRCLPPHAPTLDEREPLPSPAGAGTPSSRSRSRATSLGVPRYGPVRRRDAAAAASGGCVCGRPRAALGAQAVEEG